MWGHKTAERLYVLVVYSRHFITTEVANLFDGLGIIIIWLHIKLRDRFKKEYRLRKYRHLVEW
jgi:hypothetical protein